ncbi:MAG: hypothetical protein H8E48_03280 [Chloroflexi bacterium]|nr:hypothetical protein [Chloroflexota bacterium]
MIRYQAKVNPSGALSYIGAYRPARIVKISGLRRADEQSCGETLVRFAGHESLTDTPFSGHSLPVSGIV